MRLLIFIALIYLGYRYLKSWLTSQQTPRRTVPGRTGTSIDDVMVKDPYCNTYFPKRSGLALTVDGKELYFCSKECRDKYAALQSKGKP
jgi:uncharacterized protein